MTEQPYLHLTHINDAHVVTCTRCTYREFALSQHTADQLAIRHEQHGHEEPRDG